MDEATTEEQLEQSASLAPVPEEEAQADRPAGDSWLASEQETAQPESSAGEDTQQQAAATDNGRVPAAEAGVETVKPDEAGADEDGMSETALARTNADLYSSKSGRGRRLLTILAAILGLGLLIALAGVAYATYDFKQEHDDRILPGAVVAGVDVGGMTRGEAIRAVKDAVDPQLSRTVTVEFGEREWDVTPKQLGARSTAKRAVASALTASDEASWMDLAAMRFLDDELDLAEGVSIRYPERRAEAFIADLQKDVDRAPRDADLDYSTGWVKIVKERVGHRVVVKDSTAALMGALKGDDASVDLEVETIKPEVTADSFNQVILLRQNDYTVYLYTDGEITHQWPVAIGTGGYPTPTGEYVVEMKRYMPTWINPDPEGWGKSMPDMIPPGPGNPLGLRAINWTAAGIRFHGTSATSSIGTAASHGCVRMYNEDVIELYDLVREGSPIVSIWG